MNLRLSDKIERIYTDERGRILATLIGLFRDFDLAEEMAQEAFAAALVQWPESGVPQNPRAWIVSAARHKALDRLRREAALRAKTPEFQRLSEPAGMLDLSALHEDTIPDDRLRLIFTCCHPALSTEAQVALTLRTLCGLTTEEIARAFLVSPQTMAQRLVRVKRKIADAGIPYSVPDESALPGRIDSVLVTIYLIFTAGYAAASGEALLKSDLCGEAIRLGRMLTMLLPAHGDAFALLALMLFHDSRRDTRTDGDGNIVLLEDQDRSCWNRAAIEEGTAALDKALRHGATSTRYGIEAQIAWMHANSARPPDTDWPRILVLYSELKRVAPSPVVDLNEAVAMAMVHGPEAGLERLAELEKSGRLESYHLLPAAQARLLEAAGCHEQAREYYRAALALARNDAERRFLTARLAGVGQN